MSIGQTPKPRNTRQRALISQLMSGSDEFLTAQQIHAQLRDAGESIGLATVYRTLQVMHQTKQLDSIYNPDGEIAYRSCSEGHHHHLICRECGKAVEVEVDAFEQWAHEVAAQHGFSHPEHSVEIFGICSTCAEENPDLVS